MMDELLSRIESPADLANLAFTDWQDDGAVDISDGVALLQFLFANGISHPLSVPGAETTGCVSIPGCVGDSDSCR